MSASRLADGTMRVGELGRQRDTRRALLVWSCGHGLTLSLRKSVYYLGGVVWRRELIVDRAERSRIGYP